METGSEKVEAIIYISIVYSSKQLGSCIFNSLMVSCRLIFPFMTESACCVRCYYSGLSVQCTARCRCPPVKRRPAASLHDSSASPLAVSVAASRKAPPGSDGNARGEKFTVTSSAQRCFHSAPSQAPQSGRLSATARESHSISHTNLNQLSGWSCGAPYCIRCHEP